MHGTARPFQSRSTGSEANDLLDRRDQLLTELSKWIDADSTTLDGGREQVSLAGGAIVVGSQPVTLQARDFRDGTTGITVNGLTTPIALNSGRMGAMTTALNETLPAFRDRLRELSRQIVRRMDQQHARGIPDQGPFSMLLGRRVVS